MEKISQMSASAVIQSKDIILSPIKITIYYYVLDQNVLRDFYLRMFREGLVLCVWLPIGGQKLISVLIVRIR
tara:strand:- start:431 stop:646 length:216 start_codon:yes stop_codon:yes gene_type:complete